MESLPPRRKPRRTVLRAVFGFPKSIQDHQSIQLSKSVFVSSPRGAVHSSLDSVDVRKRGFNPFFTGVTVGIIAFITGFLLTFAYFVVSYLRYVEG
jgi:hypothetical protein